MVESYGLDCASLQNDLVNFNQTPLFEACAIKDQEKALRLVNFFLAQSVDPRTEDKLN